MNPQYAPALFGLLGVLVGFAGNILLQVRLHSWQRKQWILDTKKAEWRELIGTLVKSERCMWDNSLNFTFENEPSTETQREMERRFVEADAEARKTIQDRIFIAKRVQEERVLERWQLMTAKQDTNLFRSDWDDLHATLLKTAHEDLGVKE